MADNYAVSKDLLRAIATIEAIPENERRPNEIAALQGMISRRDAATAEVGATGAAYRGFGQGATFNLADELSAAIRGLHPEKEYGTELEMSRGRERAAQEAFPEEYGRGEFAGIAASSMLPFGVAGRAPKGAKLGEKMLRMGTAGGITAGGQTFGRGEGGFIPRVKEAIVPTVIGAGIGAGIPLMSTGGGALSRYLRGGGDNIPGVAPRAASKMVGATRQHQASGGEDIQQYLASLGPQGTIADVPGALQSRAVGLAGMPGEGGNMLNRILNERARAASGRIERVATDVIGDPSKATSSRAIAAAIRKYEGSPLYNAALAYDKPIDVTSISKSLESMVADAGPDTGAVLKRFSAAISGDDAISATKLHAIRSDLSDAAEVARRAGNSKQASVLGDALIEIDRSLNQVPGYASARQTWATTFEVDDALDAGRKALAGGPTSAQSPTDMIAEFGRMKPSEQEAYRAGVREYVASVMGTARNDVSAAKGLLGKGWNREKLSAIIGSEEAGKVFDVINAEGIFTSTRGVVSSGSKTNLAREAAADLADIRAPDTLQRPSPWKRLKIGTGEAGNVVLDALTSGRSARANADIGRILSAQGPERDRIVSALLRKAAEGKTTKAEELVIKALEPLLFGAGMGATLSGQER